MTRLDRLTAILTQLQTKPIIKAKEIAERFDISMRTVYRDMRALESAGVPIGAEAGVGYYLVDGFTLPPIMFTQEEAVALLLSSKLVEQFTDPSIKEPYTSALMKVQAVMGNADKDHLVSLLPNIKVSRPTDPNFPSRSKPFLLTIQDAIAKNKILELTYQSYSKQETTVRKIEPLGLWHYNDQWHVIANCQLRKGYRDFRLDRIQGLLATDLHFDRAHHLSLDEYLDQLSLQNQANRVVVIFEPDVVSFLQMRKHSWGFVKEEKKGERLEVTFLTPSMEGFSRWLLAFGNQVEVVFPKELSEALVARTKELQQYYL